MESITQSATIRVPLKVYLTSDHVSAATGKTVAVVISKNGGAFGNPSAGATNATEISNGWYYVDLSTTDTGTLGPLLVRGTSASCDDSETTYQVVAATTAAPSAAAVATAVWQDLLASSDFSTASSIGKLLHDDIDAAVSSRVATSALPTNFSSLSIDSNGRVEARVDVQKNTALSNFTFYLTNNSTHTALTGKVNADFTLKKERIDSAAAASLSGTITEVDSTNLPGLYQISLTAGELNGKVITLYFQTVDSDPTVITLVTSD